MIVLQTLFFIKAVWKLNDIYKEYLHVLIIHHLALSLRMTSSDNLKNTIRS